MEFVVHKIKEIAKLYSGGDAPGILSDVRTKQCNVPIFSNGLSNSGLYGYTDKAQIFEEAITVSARGTIGAVFYRNEPFFPIVRLISLLPNPELVSTKFLYYYLKSIPIDGFGTSQQQLTIPFFGKKKIKIIKNIKTQDQIATILSTYDDLIEKNNRKIAILQEMAEELYKEWFVRFRFPSYKTAKFYKGIPEDWKYGTIKDLGSFVRGKNITADEMEEGDIPVISAGIEPSGFHSKSNVQGVSLTISSSGANAGFLRINYSDIWAADCSFINDIENIFYMYELLNNMRPCIDNLQRGAAQPHVYPKDINKLKIVLPPTKLRTKFNEIAKQVHLTIATLQKQNKNLTQQWDLLLPRLMSGKLEVKA